MQYFIHRPQDKSTVITIYNMSNFIHKFY